MFTISNILYLNIYHIFCVNPLGINFINFIYNFNSMDYQSIYHLTSIYNHIYIDSVSSFFSSYTDSITAIVSTKSDSTTTIVSTKPHFTSSSKFYSFSEYKKHYCDFICLKYFFEIDRFYLLTSGNNLVPDDFNLQGFTDYTFYNRFIRSIFWKARDDYNFELFINKNTSIVHPIVYTIVPYYFHPYDGFIIDSDID